MNKNIRKTKSALITATVSTLMLATALPIGLVYGLKEQSPNNNISDLGNFKSAYAAPFPNYKTNDKKMITNSQQALGSSSSISLKKWRDYIEVSLGANKNSINDSRLNLKYLTKSYGLVPMINSELTDLKTKELNPADAILRGFQVKYFFGLDKKIKTDVSNAVLKIYQKFDIVGLETKVLNLLSSEISKIAGLSKLTTIGAELGFKTILKAYEKNPEALISYVTRTITNKIQEALPVLDATASKYYDFVHKKYNVVSDKLFSDTDYYGNFDPQVFNANFIWSWVTPLIKQILPTLFYNLSASNYNQSSHLKLFNNIDNLYYLVLSNLNNFYYNTLIDKDICGGLFFNSLKDIVLNLKPHLEEWGVPLVDVQLITSDTAKLFTWNWDWVTRDVVYSNTATTGDLTAIYQETVVLNQIINQLAN